MHESALEAMCESIVNQLLHAPLTELKRSHKEGDAALVHAVQRLFKLDVEQTAAPKTQNDAALPADAGKRRIP